MSTEAMIVNIFLGIFCVILGFMLNGLRRAIEQLRETDQRLAREVAGIQVLIAGEYVKQERFDVMVKALFEKLDRIEAKVDTKADKRE